MVIGYEYTIDEVKYCKGSIKISDRSLNVYNYNITGCIKSEDVWQCPCDPLPKKLILNFEHKEEKIYDFIYIYYVGDNNDENNKRIISREGLRVQPIKEKKIFQFPKFEGSSTTFLVVGLIIIGLIIISVIFIIFKHIYKKHDLENDNKDDEKKEIMVIEDDVADILNKYG